MQPLFDHEKLDVYQEAIAFCGWVGEFLETVSGKTAAKDQLDRASTSIPLNIAEGNGKFSSPDRCRFLGHAYGSALECAACLDVLVARGLVPGEDVQPGKERLRGIVSMLVGLMNSLSNRVAEDREEYVYSAAHEGEVEGKG